MTRSVRIAAVAVLTTMTLMVGASTAWAGSPHFVGTATVTKSGNTLTVSAKEAGLGDEPQINITLTATALCINGGGNHP
jgi:hypothetical protein